MLDIYAKYEIGNSYGWKITELKFIILRVLKWYRFEQPIKLSFISDQWKLTGHNEANAETKTIYNVEKKITSKKNGVVYDNIKYHLASQSQTHAKNRRKETPKPLNCFKKIFKSRILEKIMFINLTYKIVISLTSLSLQSHQWERTSELTSSIGHFLQHTCLLRNVQE